MQVKFQRMFVTADKRYDPKKRDTHEVDLPLEVLPSDTLIMDGPYAGKRAKEARELKAKAPTPAVASATAKIAAVPHKGSTLKDDEE